MILKKVLISYFSDNLIESKKEIVNLLSDFGIFELELIEDFNINTLDYNENYDNKRELWSVIFYLPNNKFFDKKLKMIDDKLKNLSDIIYEIYTSDLDTNSYKDEWKKSFFTTRISENVVINPSWIDYQKENENEIVVNIDPSMAFGTGGHETTKLCLKLLEKYKTNKNLLDIGCGSGILMLVASKMGFNKVVGIDIDKNCLSVVNENFKKNDLTNYEIHIGNLVDNINDKFDVVVSNILVDVLETLLKDIQKVLKEGSIVIFSGILNHKRNEFIKKANEINLHLIEEKEENLWLGLVFRYGE